MEYLNFGILKSIRVSKRANPSRATIED